MKTIFPLLLCFCCVQTFSQNKKDIQVLRKPFTSEWKRNILPIDTVRLFSLPNTNYKMPNVIKTQLPKPKYVANNGNGLDVYQLPIDNMPLVKPDSTFHSNMPVANRGFTIHKRRTE